MTFPIIPASTVNGSYQISRSLRFRSSASAYLSRTPASAGNRKTWTWSGWVKRGTIATNDALFHVYGSATTTTYFLLRFDSTNSALYAGNSATNFFITTQLFRDPSAWYHIVLTLDTTQAAATDRLKLYVNGQQVTSFSSDNRSAQITQNSDQGINQAAAHSIGRENSGTFYADGYLAEVNFIDGQALTPSSFGAFDTNGVWQPARYTGSYGTNGFYLPFSDNSSVNGTGGTSAANVSYSAGFGGWTIVNNLNAIPAGTVVDAIGVYQTSAETADYAYIVQSNGSNSFTVVASTASFNHGGTGLEFFRLTSPYTIPGSGTFYLAKYSTGAGLNWGHDTASSTSWQYYTGAPSGTQTWSTTSGGSGQPALIYRANTGLTADSSGNKNYWYGNSISLATGTTYDSMIDSPTNYADGTAYGRGNYCTLNPLAQNSAASGTAITVVDGNLKATFPSPSVNQIINATGLIAPGGKYYFEGQLTAVGGNYPFIGIIPTSVSIGATANAGVATYTNYWYGNGNIALNDIIGMAVDTVNWTFQFYKNGVASGASSSFNPDSYYPSVSCAGNSGVWVMNFGQRPFAYTPPSGFSALNTQNLPTPTIAAGNKYFDATTYTGNGSTPKTISGLGFAPDMVWAKGRSTVEAHVITDVVRGAGSAVYPNATSSEGGSGLYQFNSDGFLLNSDARLNTNNATYISWSWKAGGTGVSNTSGSITSTVSANTSAGFSVVTYTGTGANATVGHGLGAAPGFIIIKRRTGSPYSWPVYHSGFSGGANDYLILDGTQAKASNIVVWNNTNPTSSVFSIGTDAFINGSGAPYVAYCFAPVAGYSAAFSYTGNGSADGPMVYLGFRPRFVLIKCSSTAPNDWVIYDTTRNTYNATINRLFPDLSDAESTGAGGDIDVLSNGLKIRSTYGNVNASGGSYIGYAIAENPFKVSRAR